MRIVKVRGSSMLPDYQDGDFLLVGRYRFRSPRTGDDIVFRHQDLGELVKRIDRVDAEGIEVSGLSALSTEPASLGRLKTGRSDGLERVLMHFAR